MKHRLLSFVSLFLVLALLSALAPPPVRLLAAQTSRTDPPRSAVDHGCRQPRQVA